MPRLKFPVDFSRPRIARDVAAVTEHFNAKLTLLHGAYVPVLPAYPGRLYSVERKEIREGAARLMDRFVTRHFLSRGLNRVPAVVRRPYVPVRIISRPMVRIGSIDLADAMGYLAHSAAAFATRLTCDFALTLTARRRKLIAGGWYVSPPHSLNLLSVRG